MADSPVIFLVDDDSDFLELEKSIFESRGWRVRCFTDSRAAFEACSAEPPALVVSDLMMRNLDSGFSLARAVKADPQLARIPVIIVSAVSSQKGFDFHPRSAEDLAAMHADAFFDKPVSAPQLLKKAEELLA